MCAAADALAASARGIILGTVDGVTVTPTTTVFESDDITEATADHFKGRIVIFYDSADALYGQAARITAYALNGSNGSFTVTTLTEAPSDNDLFVIL